MACATVNTFIVSCCDAGSHAGREGGRCHAACRGIGCGAALTGEGPTAHHAACAVWANFCHSPWPAGDPVTCACAWAGGLQAAGACVVLSMQRKTAFLNACEEGQLAKVQAQIAAGVDVKGQMTMVSCPDMHSLGHWIPCLSAGLGGWFGLEAKQGSVRATAQAMSGRDGVPSMPSPLSPLLSRAPPPLFNCARLGSGLLGLLAGGRCRGAVQSCGLGPVWGGGGGLPEPASPFQK